MRLKSNIPEHIANPLEETRIGNMEVVPLRIEPNHCGAIEEAE